MVRNYFGADASEDAPVTPVGDLLCPVHGLLVLIEFEFPRTPQLAHTACVEIRGTRWLRMCPSYIIISLRVIQIHLVTHLIGNRVVLK